MRVCLREMTNLAADMALGIVCTWLLRTIQELFGPTHNTTQILLLPYLSSIFFHREKRRRHEVDTTEHLVRDITQYFITPRVFRAPPRGGAGTTTITLLCIITYFVNEKSNIAVDCHLH